MTELNKMILEKHLPVLTDIAIDVECIASCSCDWDEETTLQAAKAMIEGSIENIKKTIK